MNRPATWVVVGAGAAGCAFAAKAASDPSRRIILVEAGTVPPSDADTPAEVTNASGLAAAVPGHRLAAAHDVHLTPRHPYTIVRGHTLGGSTAINGTYCVQPPGADLHRWHGLVGDDLWSVNHLREVFRQIETDRDFSHHPDHGDTGPLPITRDTPDSFDRAVMAAFSDTCDLPSLADVSLSGDSGVGMLPKNVLDGRRMDAGRVFVRPLIDNNRIDVRGDTAVARIIVESGVARGIEVTHPSGSTEIIRADRVVLCAGAIMSAVLLMRSGIGPRSMLEDAGIEVVGDAPQLGQSFCDHPSVAVSWHPTEAYLSCAAGKPPFSTVARLVEGTHTLEVLPVSRPLGQVLGIESSQEEVTWLLSLLSPRSRGQISLNRDDPFGPPRINYNYLSHSDDTTALSAAVSRVRDVLAHQTLTDWVAGIPVLTGPEDAGEYVQSHLGTSYHTTSTVPAGPPGVGVVDARGMVYGVSGLQVADVSILPDGPTRGPSFMAMALGWRLASVD